MQTSMPFGGKCRLSGSIRMQSQLSRALARTRRSLTNSSPAMALGRRPLVARARLQSTALRATLQKDLCTSGGFTGDMDESLEPCALEHSDAKQLGSVPSRAHKWSA